MPLEATARHACVGAVPCAQRDIVRLRLRAVSFVEAIRTLNALKRRRVIRDYVLIGAVASTVYMEPMFTEDLDVIVLVDSDSEYMQVFQKVTQASDKVEGMHQVISGVPVQMFPTTINLLYRDTLDYARVARIGNTRVKVASPEHLILLCLEAFRPKDRYRISQLFASADTRKLHQLMRRFDDEKGTLAQRLKQIC
ncbi:MAG: hypothetical protein HY684_01440 [Chloroflexi bacterium]|nr:hypothetical protein [Chloroflexota bacterium]